eukprot:TRINITY_DN32351_c0_g1_i1.p1 TRINITY_DN32351_c0_g1~~TRINITY_DN32351_c0_g1_i1.p1  ORF type:complete len:228 (-),score=37.31 TRINITY_DN32351_c0_g1_i1:973-1656(-)
MAVSEVDSMIGRGPEAQPKTRMFGRTQSIHATLGGGQVADILLWKKWQISAAILGVAAVSWILFEWSGFTLLTLLANSALLLVALVFVWAQLSSLLNWAPPPLPELALSEEFVQWAADTSRREVNRGLAVAHSVALGKDYKLFGKVVVALYILASVGGWFNTLSLIFFGILLSFTVPYFYERNEDQVEEQLKTGFTKAKELYKVAETKARELINKIPREIKTTKKTQ